MFFNKRGDILYDINDFLARKPEDQTAKEKIKVVSELMTKYNLKFLLEIIKMYSSVFYYFLR